MNEIFTLLLLVLAFANGLYAIRLLDPRQLVARRVVVAAWLASGLLAFVGLFVPALVAGAIAVGVAQLAFSARMRWARAQINAQKSQG